LNLVNDVLDLSKIDAGHFQLATEPMRVGPLVGSTVRMVAAQAEAKDQSLTTRLAFDGRIEADPRALRQILLNLLSNAVKFTPAGGSIEVDVDETPDEGIVIRVTDNGPGIDEAHVPKALERFVQIDRVSKVSQEGTGLGLPLAAALAQAHAGELILESVLDKGTKVEVSLPGVRQCDRPLLANLR
jgi:two-component system cell cycle sensor histidine kinase PleC